MDGGNSKNVNEETPYADISKADPGASLNEQDHHVPVDDIIFKMDARVEVKDYPEKIRTSDGYIFYDARTNVRNMLRASFKAYRRKRIEALKQQNESSEPAALVVTAAVPSSPSAFADA
ncbi:hypothetical protein MKW98_016778 [Papaver atlanticum]|uniref:Uncharacterized protein n=1 Tax=Papaver atlanticum TaxID=357466 RepID=A0AAD4XY68_9MAGN|nr:hypothetical protein MKW98_016778 [Papaver atlanticum]